MKLPDQYDNYNRPEVKYEKPYGKNPVEPGASLPVRVQIEQMIGAGRKLNESRANQFDFDEGAEVPDDVQPDPTRNPEFDLADATQIAKATAHNLREQAKSAKSAKAEEENAASISATELADKPEVK